jgi:biotin carboxylase
MLKNIYQMNNFKKLLVLGTGKDQIPGIKKAKEKGFFTVGLDFDSQSAGVKLVDEFHKVNIKNQEEVLDFCLKNQNQFKGVIAFGVDIPDILAKAAKSLNCYGPLSVFQAESSKNKLIAKNLMKKAKVNLPEYKGISTVEELKRFIKKHNTPVVLKPVDNSASRGVVLIDENVNVKKAFQLSTQYIVDKTVKPSLIVEKFLTGRQLSTESILYNGQLFTIGIADRNYSLIEKFKPFIIENGGDLPPSKSGFTGYEQLVEKIDLELMKVVKAFNLKNCIIKGDLVIHNGEIYVIEVALRLSGGHFSTIEIPLSTGVDFLSYAIDIYTGKSINTDKLKFNVKNFVRLRYFLEEFSKNYKIKKLILPNENNVIADFYLKEGDSAQSHSSKLSLPVNKIGYYIVFGKTKAEMEKIENNFLSKVVIEKE